MSGPLRVLVVEDNPDGCQSLCMLVGLWGYAYRTAPDGPAGIDMALAWGPDVALVDLGLPGCDGLEVARRVRSALGTDVLLVALTAYDDDGTTGRAGFDRHLTKPAEPAELRRLLDDQAALLRGQPGSDR
jgi:two-component system, chemotaxis family, CheB/CheR fusion protein